VPGVGGTWKDLTDNVNFMASNLTGQVRNIAEVATAIANGDLSRKITVTCAAKSCSSKKRSTPWSISSTASPVKFTRVAREVGTEGRLADKPTYPA